MDEPEERVIGKIVDALEVYGDTTELAVWGAQDGWSKEDRRSFLSDVAHCLLDILSEDLADLRERLIYAIGSLDDLRQRAAAYHNTTEYARLCGKVEGLKLALSYMDGH